MIDYYRKTNKAKSFLYRLTEDHYLFAVSVITSYEIYVGSKPGQDEFWDEWFDHVLVLPFDAKANREVIRIYWELKRDGSLIDIPDLFIAGTAIANNLRLATYNEKHFGRIQGLDLILDSEV